MGTALKAGDVGVPALYAKLLRDAAADCDEKLLTAPLLAAQLKRRATSTRGPGRSRPTDRRTTRAR